MSSSSARAGSARAGSKIAMHVKSDNFDGYMSIPCYREFRLELSTGDFHTHKATSMAIPFDEPMVIGWCLLTGAPCFDTDYPLADD